ncbi:HugZ family protein [Beijerinckia indica]|uniref:Pyridoxamine 5'-phosphate oxidase-related FMN-binding n=1 Tax=Beijerinckia indica subsp. indica (strain ATCC 9039 / DSM 1715 / NCIMB 8712) TaxID=395963 RepID=B2IJT9_BEII9|nr:DUF2470 domain-containing protein [Beijerinckia indica]ACB96314.1 pyridoxamine 5'-phosphate oxidase-related FMN-binding [Beijerinckia indica subsp. indica ATCC 9039]
MNSKDNGDKSGHLPSYDAVSEAKRLLRVIRAGTLATLAPEDGFPFASLVNVATEPDGSPLLLISALATHTKHLIVDDRVSLLLVQTGPGDPLAHPRLTVTGRAEVLKDSEARETAKRRFLNRHPKSALYADFPDFSFCRIRLQHAHLNGGFGRAGQFSAAQIQTSISGSANLISSEVRALTHLNADHAVALALLAKALAEAPDGDWRATGIDPEGLDLACGDRTARIVFPALVHDAEELRKTLENLVDVARVALSKLQHA